MSISALLTNTDEASYDTSPKNNNPRSTQTQKRRSLDNEPDHSLSMSRSSLRQAPHPVKSVPTASSFRSADTDVTDTEQGFSNRGGGSAENGSFRGFKYHDTVNLVVDDPDKTDSELDDDGFAQERVEYLKRIRKRHLELEGQENERRKVGAPFLQFLPVAGCEF